MGLAQALGCEMTPSNAAQRAEQRIAATRPGGRIVARAQPPLDKMLFSRTNGTTTAASVLSGLPVILLTTTGAKSGIARTTPIFGIPLGDDLALIGSNYGRESAPGWVHNLTADPAATVRYGDRTVLVTARGASDEEADQVFARAADIYPGYEEYRSRAAHRPIRVFVLEPSQ
jgi:deazaflavin-dependent oxidoreductase (nitroreductase family)